MKRLASARLSAGDLVRQTDAFQRQVIEVLGRMVDILHDISDELHQLRDHAPTMPVAEHPAAAAAESNPDDLLTVAQLSAWLQVPEHTLYTWRSKHEGPPGLRIGRYTRYRRGDVTQWLAEQQDQRRKEQLRSWRSAHLPGHPTLPNHRASRDKPRCRGSSTEPRHASPYPGRGVCAVCNDHILVNKNGLLRIHDTGWRAS